MLIRTLLPALVAFLLAGVGSASAATLDSPWTGGGSGTTKVVSTGQTADPQFDYGVNDFTGSWTFSAVAASARSIPVAYDSSGYYSWYQVSTKLERFIQHGAAVTYSPLEQEGPVDCCEAPSGGFDYKGTTTFDVQPGDVYGFRVSGSNFT